MNNKTTEFINVPNKTLGQLLKAEREAKKLTHIEVAQRLLLSRQIIMALEEDNYSKIPAQVYAEGYLKAYAQLLQIPIATVLASFRRMNVYSQPVTPITPVDKGSFFAVFKSRWLQDQKNRRLLWLILGAVVAVIIVLVLIVVPKSDKTTAAVVVPTAENSSAVADEDNKPVLPTPLASENQTPVVTPAPAAAVLLDAEKKIAVNTTNKSAADVVTHEIPLTVQSAQDTVASDNKKVANKKIEFKPEASYPEPKIIISDKPKDSQ